MTDAFVASFKLLLIGDSNVGKSCLASRFVSDRFSYALKPTIGIDFRSKDVVIDGNGVKVTVRNFSAVALSLQPPPARRPFACRVVIYENVCVSQSRCDGAPTAW